MACCVHVQLSSVSRTVICTPNSDMNLVFNTDDAIVVLFTSTDIISYFLKNRAMEFRQEVKVWLRQPLRRQLIVVVLILLVSGSLYIFTLPSSE